MEIKTMKVKNTIVLRNLAGSNVVVPVGNDLVDFNGMITLNETGAFLWKCLTEHKTHDELTEALMNEYTGVEKEEAGKDIDEFIAVLDKNGILEYEE